MILSMQLLGILSIGMILGKTHLGSIISTPAIVLVLGMVASNFNFIPYESSLYEDIFNYLLPVTIPLLLFNANIKKIIVETKTMLAPFILGALFTCVGAIVATLLTDIGEYEAKLAGIMSATFVGGSVNFLSVSSVLNIENGEVVAAAFAADNVLTAVYLVILSAISAAAAVGKGISSTALTDTKRDSLPDTERDSFKFYGLRIVRLWNLIGSDIRGITISILISILIALVGYSLASFVNISGGHILAVTIITVIVANLFPQRFEKLEISFSVGNILMYIFFVAIGATTNIKLFLESSFGISIFIMIILSIHFFCLFVITLLWKLDFKETVIASCACITGPGPAVALATSRGWQHLITPGLLCGIAGYAIANFLGLMIAHLLA